MENEESCDSGVKEGSPNNEEMEEKVEEVIIRKDQRLNIRKDSLFLTRKRLSKEGKREMGLEVFKTTNSKVDPKSSHNNGSPFQIKVDASLSENGSTQKTEMIPETKKQRHVIIIEDELRENDNKD